MWLWGNGMTNFKMIGLGAVAAGALMASSAQAAILNISATSTTPVLYTFDPGTYLIQWIGTADGGAYDGWNPSCPSGDCSSGWREVFAATTDTGPHPSIDSFSIPGPTFSSALAALAAFQSAPFVIDAEASWNGSSYVLTGTQMIAQPWHITIAAPTTVSFFIAEPTKEDNFGGVSLRISAVPEPATWAMMILGMGGVGMALRQRRRLAAVEVR